MSRHASLIVALLLGSAVAAGCGGLEVPATDDRESSKYDAFGDNPLDFARSIVHGSLYLIDEQRSTVNLSRSMQLDLADLKILIGNEREMVFSDRPITWSGFLPAPPFAIHYQLKSQPGFHFTLTYSQLTQVDQRTVSITRTEDSSNRSVTREMAITGGDGWRLAVNEIDAVLSGKKSIAAAWNQVTKEMEDLPRAVASRYVTLVDPQLTKDRTTTFRVERWANKSKSDGLLANENQNTPPGPSGRPVWGTYERSHTRYALGGDGKLLLHSTEDGEVVDQPVLEYVTPTVHFRYHVSTSGAVVKDQ